MQRGKVEVVGEIYQKIMHCLLYLMSNGLGLCVFRYNYFKLFDVSRVLNRGLDKGHQRHHIVKVSKDKLIAECKLIKAC